MYNGTLVARIEAAKSVIQTIKKDKVNVLQIEYRKQYMRVKISDFFVI